MANESPREATITLWGKPNTHVTGRKVSSCQQGFGRRGFRRKRQKTRQRPSIGSSIGRLPYRKWLDFVSQDGKSEAESNLWVLGVPLVSKLRAKLGSTLRLVTRVLGLPHIGAFFTEAMMDLRPQDQWPQKASQSLARRGSSRSCSVPWRAPSTCDELDKPAKASQDFITGSPLKPESGQPSTKRGGIYARESSGSPWRS
jgi:hypothetical protein